MRTTVIAGNWKMHHGPDAARAFFDDFAPEPGEGEREAPEILLFPPTISLTAALEAPGRRPELRIGVQNLHWEDEGAYTGETSPAMAAATGATHALVGHSERRHVFGESDEDVARKVAAARRHALVPVVCVGETLDERRDDRVEEVISRQLRAALGTFEGEPADLLVAYEPVWAIGTGETATPEDASAAHRTLREGLAEALGPVVADGVRILYGGSVKPHNAAELLDAPDVDGVLVGGASLEPADFAAIVEAGWP